MIDQKTALVCAALIAFMVVAAAWRVVMLDDWTSLIVLDSGPLPSLLIFFFPACSALVVGALCWDGRGAGADAKLQTWRNWGRSLSISYCGGLLLLQGLLIVGSLGLGMPFDFSAISRGLGLLLAVMCLLAINRIPKLPWFERRVAPGGKPGTDLWAKVHANTVLGHSRLHDRGDRR